MYSVSSKDNSGSIESLLGSTDVDYLESREALDPRLINLSVKSFKSERACEERDDKSDLPSLAIELVSLTF